MIRNIIRQVQFTLRPQFEVAYGYQGRRRLFDKTGFIENWVPRTAPFPISRKPRLPQWEDQEHSWPNIMPPPTKNTGKNLIREIEQEEKSKMVLLRDFHLPDFRVGDIIQMKWTHSTSDGKTNTYTGNFIYKWEGLVLAVRKKNSLEGGFHVMYRFCGMLIKMYVKFYSPFLKDLKILRRGSGNVRNKLAMWEKEDPSPTTALTKRTMKRRYEDGLKMGDAKLSPKFKFDVSDDPLLK